MKLFECLAGVEVLERHGSNVEINAVCNDTAKIEAGCLFVCIAGQNTDTHTMWQQAMAGGAVAFVTERRLGLPVPEIIVRDTRAALSLIASNFFGRPTTKLRTVAVVGTNGKTTTTHIIREILRACGHKVCLIGTNGYAFGDQFVDTGFTTPDPVELQKILALAVMEGCGYAVMEVSAHAIALKKTDGVLFDIGVFTNLSRDHLDYFGDMAHYGATKASFFCGAHIKRAVVNSDDALGRKLLFGAGVPTVSYGVDNPADIFAIDYESDFGGSRFVVNAQDEIYEICTPFRGAYNMCNTLAAIACCTELGLSLEKMAEALGAMPQVAGRYQTFHAGDFAVVIDYAHTPDGIEKILTSVSEWAKGRILCVVGCGGNRDGTKRPLMASAAQNHCDEVWLTSDNPRFEDPERILDEMETGLNKARAYHRICDRKAAIGDCFAAAKSGDVIVILGKGSENYLDVLGHKMPYCDAEVVKSLGAIC